MSKATSDDREMTEDQVKEEALRRITIVEAQARVIAARASLHEQEVTENGGARSGD